jgi:site-specific DNA recombinase
VRSAVDAAVLSNYELTDELREQYAKRLAALERKESYLLDLAAEEGWPKDVLRAKVPAIRQERYQIQDQLDHAEQQLDIGRDVFLKALNLLDNRRPCTGLATRRCETSSTAPSSPSST